MKEVKKMQVCRSSSPMTDERLSQLLKLKSAEKPSKEFWDAFDASMERKCLRELCGTFPSRRREVTWFGKKWVSPFFWMAMSITFAFLGFSPRIYHGFRPNTSVAAVVDLSSCRYVQDVLELPQEGKMSRRDVMEQEVFSAHYVCDRIALASKTSFGHMASSVPMCF
ncbi:MAG: hypothetical protein LBG98_01000 [Puniceicoccales bacterium]|nr:hypothetical protein [Puniceicoccales bacterium]